MTFLFTDVVGSTELLEQLGEDAAEACRQAHFGLLREAVAARGGAEVKSLGDGLMVVFTSPLAALHCAVAMQQEVAREGRRQARPLAVRIGLHAGEPMRDEGDFFGTPVVVAKRLCDRAEGGQILASMLVRDLVGRRGDDTFTFRHLGGLTLKGLAEPVAACEAVWAPTPDEVSSSVAAEPGPLPLPLGREERLPLVGRAEELARLDAAWAAARSGQRQVVLLAGEPGVGKTRLTADLARQVHAEGAIVIFGRCDEGMGVPYQPFVEALGRYLREAPAPILGRLANELARLVPEVAERIRGLPPPLRSDPETERYRLFDALVAWLSAASEAAPVLLVLDDLHWATKPTLLLLRHLVRSDEALSLLTVAAYRDSPLDMTADLADVLAEVLRQPGVERMSLSGLDEAGVGALMEAQARHELDDEGRALAGVLHAETAGNPFFVREMLRHLAEKGTIVYRDDHWVAAQRVAEVDIPDSVREVVGRRLTRLPDETTEALALAAVLGERFELAVLAEAVGGPEISALRALGPAVAARLVGEAGVGRYHFAHALVRSTLEDALGPTRRAQLHQAAGLAVEAVHAGDLDDHLPELAHHFTRAEDHARAVEYAARAGDRALAQLAHDDAVAYYRQALELLDAAEGPGDDARRTELLIALGEAQRRAGDRAYRQSLLEAARLAEARGDADALARAALANSRGYFSVAGRIDAERMEVLQAALDVVGPDDSARRARLLANLAVELTWASQPERRDRLATEALAMARRISDSDPATLGHVLAMRYTPTAPVDLHDDLADLAAVATQLNDPALAFWAANWGAQNALVIGDRSGFDAGLDASACLARELRQPFLRWAVAFVRSTQSRIAGRLEDAEGQAREGLELGQAAGIPDSFRVYGVQLFWIRYDQGRLDEVIDLLSHAGARADPDPLTLAALALTLVELDRHDEARHVLDRLAVDDFAALPSNYARLYGLTMVADACAGVGDAEHAVILHDRITPYPGLVGTVWSGATGCVDHYLGLLAVTMDRLDEAEVRFSAAEALHRRMCAPIWLARTNLEWARMLLGRRRSGDAERARELLDQTLATARELGLRGVQRRAVALLS